MQQQPQNGTPQLESKNLMILEDQMNHEALAVKKCEMMATTLTDPQLKGIAQAIAQHHRQHFDKLLNYLNSHQ